MLIPSNIKQNDIFSETMSFLNKENDNDQLLKCFVEGKICSKYLYFNDEITNSYLKMIMSSSYSLLNDSHKLFLLYSNSIIEQVLTVQKPVRIICLGAGNAKKETAFIDKIVKNINYKPEVWLIDISSEMLRIGYENIMNTLEERINAIDLSIMQMDFHDLDNCETSFSEKCNVILLLGNTLGNFDDSFLHLLYSYINIGDFVVIDNQLKQYGKLSMLDENALLKIYDNEIYSSYMYSVLKQFDIVRTDGYIHTYISYESKYENSDCAVVNKDFIFTKDKQLSLGSNMFYAKNGFGLNLLVSKKYTLGCLRLMVSQHFDVINTFAENQYALITAQKKQI